MDGDSLRRGATWSSALTGKRKQLLVEALITYRLAFSFASVLSVPMPGREILPSRLTLEVGFYLAAAAQASLAFFLEQLLLKWTERP